MYNESLKERFIDYRSAMDEESTLDNIRIIFNASELTEIQKEKDIYLFTKMDIVDYLKGLNSKSPAKLRVNCSILKNYYDYCKDVEHLIDDQINYFDASITSPIIDEIFKGSALNDKYFNEEYVKDSLDSILDVSNKFIFYAPFYGIKDDNLYNLTIEDLDELNKTVKLLDGKTVNVDDLFIKLMKNANNSEAYCENGYYRDLVFDNYLYANSKFVLKRCSKGEYDEPITGAIAWARMKTIKRQVGNDYLSFMVLYKNGLINFIKKKFEEQGIDLETAILKKDNLKYYTYSEQIQKYIYEYGAKLNDRMLRMEIKDYIHLLK